MNQLINLVIVDMQNDFMDDGKLPVQGAYQAKRVIESYIEFHYEEIGYAIISQDYHPKNHCSFEKFGGIHPEHCVEYTKGAMLSFDTSLLNGIMKFYTLKGRDESKEEYSAFTNAYDCSLHYFALEDGDFTNYFNKHDEYVVCGVAGDICVLETLKDMIKYIPAENITVLWNGTASLDGGSKLKRFCIDNDIKISDYNEEEY